MNELQFIPVGQRYERAHLGDQPQNWPLGSRLARSLKVITTELTDLSATHDFLLTIHNNHGPISYRFQDVEILAEKLTFFHVELLFIVPQRGFPLELGYINWALKTRTIALPGREKKANAIFCRFDIVHECDGQTDGQTDTGQQLVPRLCIASRGKNETPIACVATFA